ncbi:MAG: TetR/AcrR family transcriptional regulator [Nocardioidaceae bacterium]
MATGQSAPTVAAPPRPLRADAQRNYARLVEAARAAFTQRGNDVALEEVARRADVGIGTLYRHFPSRLALVEAVYRDGVDNLVESARELVSTRSPWDALELWLRQFVGYAAEKKALMHELADAIGKDSELFTHSREVIIEAMTLVLVGAQTAGAVRRDVEPADLLRLIGGCTMMPNLQADQQERILAIVLGGVRA